MEHIQTPRKVKPKLNSDSEEWIVHEDDEDSLSQPFDNTSTFMKEFLFAGRPVGDQVTLLENFLIRSTSSDQKEIFSTTGRMLKEAKVAQDYHVTVWSEVFEISIGL